MGKAGRGNAKRQTGKRRPRSRKQTGRLTARLESAIGEERKRLAREIHDELGQTLTAIKLELARTIELFDRTGTSPDGLDRLHSLTGLAEIGLATIKRIAADLRPDTRDEGLIASLRHEAAALEARSGLRVHLAYACKRALTDEQEETLFRIVQESLTNIVRHAEASTVRVRLAERNSRLEVRVSDNGRGITPAESVNPHSLGLLGMRERTALLGGTFAISGRPGKGTVMTVHVPLSRRRPR